MIDNFAHTEQWKAIDGYDGLYEVSSLGRVRSLKYGKVRVLRPGKVGVGYLQVSLSKDNKAKRFYVHRLVANAFIPNNDESKNQVNHIDECKQNNRASNLEWCDCRYNNTYNGLHHRRMANYHRSNYRRNAIKDLYDPKLSIDDNIELFKSNGIECSRDTVRLLRKDLGLTKHYRPRKKAN